MGASEAALLVVAAAAPVVAAAEWFVATAPTTNVVTILMNCIAGIKYDDANNILSEDWRYIGHCIEHRGN